MTERTCCVDNCERPLWYQTKGWCRLHYMRWLRRGSLELLPRAKRPVNPCSVAGCERPSHARGICGMHYSRMHKAGAHTAAPRRVPAKSRGCAADGCGYAAHSSAGYCVMHQRRLDAYGDPLAYKKHQYRYEQPSGYVYVVVPGHPLHDTVNVPVIAEHRAVLWDAIGDGEHPCHWCGRTVSWSKVWPKDIDALVVDHLNDERADNRPENLVPSCNPCNVARSPHGAGISRPS